MAMSLLALAASLLAAESPAAHSLQVPAGFRIVAVAQAPMVRFPMFGALDDRRRLFVAESSGGDLYDELQKLTRHCRISVLRDRNGDGTYDDSQVFATELVFPMGLVWHEGKLFVADPPNLIGLEDTDGDGKADKKTIVLSGFGHVDNGSLHGLTIGPDQRLYMTTGQPDGYKLKRAEGSFIEGKSGALLRCKPDGSEVEVLARGFENLVEVVFLPGGEIIGTDNWFRLPQEGVRDALVHLVTGGVYPLNAHARTEAGHFFSGELLPAIQLYPAVAHSGLMRYGGSNFPAAMRGNLFSAQFNTRKVVRHELSRRGATFESKDEEFISTDDPDFHPSDVLQDADGSLLIVDTGSWYVHHCPTGRIRKTLVRGGIYRVRYEGAAEPDVPANPEDELVREVRALADEPKTIALLADARSHVRLAAAEALARCGTHKAIPAIVESLTQIEPDPFLTHALICTLHRVADSAALEMLLSHPHPEVKRAAMVLLDQAPNRSLRPSVALAALKSSDNRLRTAAVNVFQNHPDWKPHVASYLRDALDEPAVQDTVLQELIPIFATAEVRGALLRGIRDEKRSSETRVALLRLAARCRFGQGDQESLRSALLSALQSVDVPVVREALRIAVDGLESECRRITANPSLPVALRIESLAVVVRKQPILDAASLDLLVSALAPRSAVSLRLSAAEVAAAAVLSPPQFKRFLTAVQSDPLISPALVFSAAQKSGYSEELLPYLSQSVQLGWQIPQKIRDWLEASAPQAELKKILNDAAPHGTIQARQLAGFEPLLSGGDPNRGHQVYLGKAGCGTCHRIGKNGGVVGPDLTRIGAIRAPRDLLESLVVPSATIAQGYDMFEVELVDGETLSGIQVRQFDGSFVLRDSIGAEKRIDPNRINRVDRLRTSMMPDGLLTALEREEIRDLLAYLQSLK